MRFSTHSDVAGELASARRWLVAGRWPTWIVLLLALGVVLRVREYLAARSLWLDESLLALELIQNTPRELLGPLDFYQAAPAGFLLGEKAIGELVGYSEMALRFLPLVLGILALFVFVPVARRTVAASAVPVALTLMVVADGLVYYAAEAKQYSVDVFAAVCLLAAAAPLARAVADRRALLLAFAVTPLIWFSHAAIFVATGCGVVIVVTAVVARRRERLVRVLPVVAAWALACLIVVLTSPDYDELRAGQADASDVFVGQADSVLDPSWVVTFGGSVALALGFPGAGPLALLAKLAAGLAVVGFVFLLRRSPVAAVLLGAPVGTMLIVSALDLYPLYERTTLFLVPIVALLFGEGVVAVASLFARPHRSIAFAAATLLVIALPVATAAERFVDRPVREELKPALSYARDRWERDDILYLNWHDQAVYLYYISCGCFDAAGPSGGSLPTAVRRLEGDAAQNYAVFESRTAALVLGRDEARVGALLHDLDRVRGRRRVWVLVSRVEGDDRAYREHALPERLDRLGRRLDAYVGRGSTAYLYDLSR